mgnify:CR=1 FL=1
MIPQPGVYEIEQMDYIFVQACQTKQAIRRKYGVDVAAEGEAQPDLDRVENEPFVAQPHAQTEQVKTAIPTAPPCCW